MDFFTPWLLATEGLFLTHTLSCYHSYGTVSVSIKNGQRQLVEAWKHNQNDLFLQIRFVFRAFWRLSFICLHQHPLPLGFCLAKLLLCISYKVPKHKKSLFFTLKLCFYLLVARIYFWKIYSTGTNSNLIRMNISSSFQAEKVPDASQEPKTTPLNFNFQIKKTEKWKLTSKDVKFSPRTSRYLRF